MQTGTPNSPASDPKQKFQAAVALLEARQYAQAQAAAASALLTWPNDPNFLRVLGVALCKQHQFQEAERHLVHVTRLVPNYAPAYENLAEAQMLQGKLPEAVKSLQTALKHNPQSHAASMKLGELLNLTGKGAEADEVFQNAIAADPEREKLVQAMDFVQEGKIKDAEAVYKGILRTNPNHVDTLRLMGVLSMKKENHSDGEAYFRRAVELAPDFWTAWINLGVSLNEQQKFGKAEQAYLQALKLKPGNVHTLEKLGSNCMNDGRMEDAVGWLKKSLEEDPQHFPSLLVMGHALKTIGEQEEAIDAYRKCAESKPDFGEVYWSLANLKTYKFDDAELDEMKSQLETVANDPTQEDSEISFLFALGKAYEDRKDYPQAFHYYAEGNTKKRLNVTYDPIEFEAHIDRLIDVYSADFFASHQGQGCQEKGPILIVGLPRSGSTLQEQILASHSQVEGTAELHYLLRIATDTGVNRTDGIKYPECMHELKDYQLRGLGEEYLESTLPHRTGLPYFTDKLPNNFTGIGFLHTVLPNAKVIDARRHPLDSCLGGFKQLFAKGQVFTYDMYDLAHYYSQYIRMMDHWDAVLPGKVLTVNYEEVVANLEGQARKTAAHCGLEWEDQMLRFYETERAVKTASSEQVRQPIYSGSVHLWRRYEEQLQELIEFLEPVLMRLPKEDRPISLQSD
ncbi:MAG: sulfotransferase [Kordiimonadaceae bacterium]|nr:sulfotransferase [Kordiimonadaceae bacterium]MBO6568671.1 sulfotransferase [Kordiimonadaceae bacterium]MBO6965353.1 sulfotransferase [Kordiimonadaceae bacterium]